MAKDKVRNRRGTPGQSGATPEDAPLDELMACYTPKQREAYVEGMRIMAQVAIRAHLKREAAGPEAPQDSNGEEG